MRKVLLIRLGGLGDLLVVLPSILLVRKCLPSYWVSLICRDEYGEVLKETGVVDECLSQEARHITPLFSGSIASRVERNLRLQDIDRVVGWFQKKSSLSGLDSVLSSGRMSFRFLVYDKHSQETISRNFYCKTREFIDRKTTEWPHYEECTRLPLSSLQKKEGQRLLGKKPTSLKEKIIVIHPGSGSREKCWPFPDFLEVVQRLHHKNLIGVLVTGPAEEWLEQEIQKSILPENWIWLRNPSLLRLAGLLSSSSYYLGNDSGITHLAAACGTVGLALFRKDLVKAWKPYGHISVLSEASVAGISSEAVWAKIEGQLLYG